MFNSPFYAIIQGVLDRSNVIFGGGFVLQILKKKMEKSQKPRFLTQNFHNMQGHQPKNILSADTRVYQLKNHN